MATQILPFARLQKALAAGPAAYREAMAYLAGEGGAQVAATQFPDSMAAQIAGAVSGDMTARGLMDSLDGLNVRRITGDEPPIDDEFPIDDGPLPEGEPEGTVLGISDQSESDKMLETLRPEITTEIGDRKRVGTTGQYVGAPEGVNNPQKLAALTKSMTNLTKEGEFGRFWYERSGRQILDITGGNKADAEKIIQAVAITSANTPVASNFDFAIQAYYQWKNGQPIKTGMYTTAMSKKLQKMFEGEDWAGRKTNNFYNNLMREVDPSKVQGVTTDLWMMRAFGFDKDAPTSAQYSFVENETKRIAENLGWEPQQVQASIWVALKSRMENQGVKDAVEAKSIKNGWMHYETIKGKKVRVIDDKNKHAANWLDQALKYSPTDADRAAAGFDYADAANNNLAQISWETIPSKTSGHMPEIFETTPEIKQDYHVQMSKAFLDDNGNDLIAQKFEILSPGDFEAPGYYEGLVSPGTQTEITAPRQYGLTRRLAEIKKQADATRRPEEGADLVGPSVAAFEKDALAADLREATYATEPAAREAMFAYAAARGILLKQDGIGLHRPAFINGLSRPKSNGIEINIGRPLTARETSAIAKAVAEEAGHTEFNPIGSPNGARFINFDYMGLPNVQFQKLVNKALEKVTFDNNETVDAAMFGADTGYLGNDWTENLNGESYLEAGELAGRPDLQRKIRDIVAQLAPRVSAVEDEFSNRYNWTRNRNLNSTYENAEALVPQSLRLQDEELGAVTPAAKGPEAQVVTEQQRQSWREANKGDFRQEQTPELAEAAEKLGRGEISISDYSKEVDRLRPITPLTNVPQIASFEDIASALDANKVAKGIIGLDTKIADGTMVGSRLDIPAYNNYNTWVVSVHEGAGTSGSSLGYGKVAVLDDVQFNSNPKAAYGVATGDKAKAPFARMNGKWRNVDPEVAKEQAENFINDPNWTQVGMNPYRHSFFYDKATGQPVDSAKEVIQIGPLVLARDVKTRPLESPEHALDPKKRKKGEPDYFKSGGSVERVYNDNRTYK